MITTAKGSEMLAASVSQASFNIQLTWCIFRRFVTGSRVRLYTSRDRWYLMALTGALFAWMLTARNKRLAVAN